MTLQQDSPPLRVVRPHEVAWQVAGPGLDAKPLWSDPATERRAYIGRIAPGTGLPPHRHLGEELVYVVEGEVGDESGILEAGQASYRPKGCVHSLFTEKGTTVLIVVSGGTEPAENVADAPRSQPIKIGRIDWAESHSGVSHKEIWADPPTERSMRLVRFDPGATVPQHRHFGEELVFGIEGEVTDESGSVLPGDLSCRATSSVHSLQARNGATVLQYLWGGTEYISG
jgi:anti-sigma factor ChrR (cupin superfamily)